MSTAFRNGGERLPEELVVEMPASVEFDLLKKTAVVFHVLAIRSSQGLRSLLLQGIEVVDVRAMVLSIVEIHQVAADHWLKVA